MLPPRPPPHLEISVTLLGVFLNMANSRTPLWPPPPLAAQMLFVPITVGFELKPISLPVNGAVALPEAASRCSGQHRQSGFPC